MPAITTGSVVNRRSHFRWLLVTLFLGSVNDNALKVTVSLLAVDRLLHSRGPVDYVSLASFGFILPGLFFSTYSGFLADRFSKRAVLIAAKLLEIGVVTLAFWALASDAFAPLLLVVFLMGLHSTLVTPAKFGILPEMFPESRISWANGTLQMVTFVAIIFGTALGGQLVERFSGAVHRTSAIFLGIAVVGTLTSLGIPRVPASASRRPFELNFLGEFLRSLGDLRRQPVLFIAMLGAAYFWFLGTIFQLNILVYAKETLGVGGGQTSWLLVAIGLGIGLGSYLAGIASGDQIEFGLIPLGAIGISVASIAMLAFRESFAGTLAVLAVLGLSSGFFIVPLNAYIQQVSPPDARGRNLATLNVLTFMGTALASLLLWALRSAVGLDSAGIFLAIGLGTLLATYYIAWVRLPFFFLRFVLYLLTHTIYRIQRKHPEHVPREGPAILVSNHLSYVDPLLILASVPRPIAFLMERRAYDHPLLRPFARMLKVIPISGSDSPKELQEAIELARDRLRRGGIVCVFAEQRPSRLGTLLGFQRGVEHIGAGLSVPIVPVSIERIWGSIFSYEGGRVIWKRPKRIPYPVTVAFGVPLPAESSAFRIRNAVAELGSDSFRERVRSERPLHEEALRRLRRSPWRRTMTDHTGRQLRQWQCLAITSLLAQAVRERMSDGERMVGILLPPSCAAALLNLAVLLEGRVPVNLNYTVSPEALESAMRQCGISRVWTSPEFLKTARVTLDRETIDLGALMKGWGPWDVLRGALRGFRRRGPGASTLEERAAKMDEVAAVIFSSGSTGEPKGVQLSHANIRANVEGIYQIMNPTPEHRFLGALPFFHSFGFTATIWYPLLTGVGVCYHPSPLDAKGIGEVVATRRVTHLITTPTFLSSYARRCTPEQFATLEFVLVGAEKLSPRVAEEFENKFGFRPLEGYGCTELSPIASVGLPHRETSHGLQVGHKHGTIGRPIPGVVARIVDPDTFETLGPGAEGLLLIKGANVMLGYLGKPELTADVIREGWYVTGDIARLDEDGFLTITDRLSRFSKIGGEMVPHGRIEEKLHELLAATETVCAVTSVPDEKKGERLVVLHVGLQDIDALHRGLTESDLPNLWVPKRDSFFAIDAFPLLGSGKLDLKALRSIAQERARQEAPNG